MYELETPQQEAYALKEFEYLLTEYELLQTT